MGKTVLVLGNGFDMDLGINLSFSKWRESTLCFGYELDKLNPKGDQWNDFERALRQSIIECYSNGSDIDARAKAINLFFHGFWKYFSVFFSEETKDYPDTRSVNENCAFEVLKHLNEKSSVFTFNYTYPYEYTNLTPLCDFTFVHGRYYKDYFVDGLMMMVQSSNMIIGIDYNRISQQIKDNPYFKPIIKRMNPSFEESGIEQALFGAETVIFFGQSLSITDSDYFDDFFTKVISNEIPCAKIYIVTCDQQSYDRIVSSTKEWGVDWDRISKCKTKVIPIFTSLKVNQPEFTRMLALL